MRGSKLESLQPQISHFAFDPEHKRRTDRLPVAAHSTATEEAAIDAHIPGMLAFAPRRRDTAGIGPKQRVAQIGDARVAFLPCAPDITAKVAPRPAGDRDIGARPHGHPLVGCTGYPRQSNCQKRDAAQLCRPHGHGESPLSE